ncbi:MAG: OmpA family protein [Nitrospiraceae bacterium]|nr:OmpA family protein [Nitrospiraceae bacterium]
MNSPLGQEASDGPSTSASGIADLMTSLAVIFILLLAAYITRVEDGNAKPTGSTNPATAEHDVPQQPPHLTVEQSTVEPDVMRVVIPEAILNFELGKSTLLPTAEAFLADTIPYYATMICGPQGHEVESFVIEGYTDDQGDDIRNLRLSQDRSFAVLVKGLEVIRTRLPWAYECFQQKASANGRGRQDLVRNATGQPDREKSRRVIFKIHLRHT